MAPDKAVDLEDVEVALEAQVIPRYVVYGMAESLHAVRRACTN
jgi:hypothetical protein